jgi:hypothetical protein
MGSRGIGAYVLVAESSSAVTFVSQALCLFCHEVGDRVGGEGGCDIAQFDMLAQKWMRPFADNELVM